MLLRSHDIEVQGTSLNALAAHRDAVMSPQWANRKRFAGRREIGRWSAGRMAVWPWAQYHREKSFIESSALVAFGLVFCLLQRLIVLPDVSIFLSARVQESGTLVPFL